MQRVAHCLRRAAAAALLVFWGASATAQPIGQPEGATGRLDRRALDAPHELVVAANPLAADTGLEILHAGGSAVDAAVAVQLVLGLVEPQSSGLGGGGFLLYWSQSEQRVRSFDGRETAPAAAREDRFVEPSGRVMPFFDAVVSGKSIGVPGALRLLERVHARYGRLPWARLFEPAIRLADAGFPMSPRLHGLLARDKYLRADAAARALYYRDDGTPHPVGAPIANPAYAATLRTIAEKGADAFYRGPIADDIVRAVSAEPRPGDMTAADLAGYRALERAPVCGHYRRHRICGMGPPSAGAVVLLQILGILQRSDFAQAAPGSVEAIHLFSEAGRLAYADRNQYIADPAFVPQPVAGLLAPAYLDARAKLIGERSMGAAEPGRPAGIAALGPATAGHESGTTHFVIVERNGDAVTMSASIENAFGARRMVRGFLLNNELTDFAFDPRRRGAPAADRVQGGKRPRSTMSPTFVFAPDGSLEMMLGSPGGRAIANYVAKVIVGVLDWKLDLQAAVALPNFGSTNGPTFIERGSAYENLAEALEARGHVLNLARMTSGVHAIERTPQGWRGAADPRREGVARGD
jgi:gamma-glutamyltranspeptidase / glutathione hydrolase